MMYVKIGFVFIGVAFITIKYTGRYLPEGEVCPISHNNDTGICKRLSDCTSAKRLLRKHIYPPICSYIGFEPVICCQTISNTIPNSSTTGTTVPSANRRGQLPVHVQSCNSYRENFKAFSVRASGTLEVGDIDVRISGGFQAQAREFPHMALLGYETGPTIEWQCGGSLISERFVMTAAHCLNTGTYGMARYVRLGDFDISTADDDAGVQQFNITDRYRHPNFNPPSRYNDIGLVKLDRNVTFTEYVLPACLHNSFNIPISQVVAIGYGATEFGGEKSNTLLAVQLDVYTQETCYSSYDSEVGGSVLRVGIDAETQVCAGGTDDERDTCQGDSGGPLQMRPDNDIYFIVGITSFGRGCGTGTIPAVYTRVSAFVPWIESIVWPS